MCVCVHPSVHLCLCAYLELILIFRFYFRFVASCFFSAVSICGQDCYYVGRAVNMLAELLSCWQGCYYVGRVVIMSAGLLEIGHVCVCASICPSVPLCIFSQNCRCIDISLMLALSHFYDM